MELRGRVAKKYPDDINTDYIIPAYLLQESWDKQFFADHAFEYYDPTFKAACRANRESIVVAGNNFGCGSSREQAVYAVKYNNVVAVVAQSFPDIFYRNSLNNGLLPIQIPDTGAIETGDELLIDLDARSLRDLARGTEYPIAATDAAIEQMKRGGFLGYVRERLRQRLKAPEGPLA
ncbi:MAG: 3-isopropylmalate dehydratase small subunit [Nitrososphaerales archaeon]|jgi:3-isopropylmalate/(R)-2-methylmalate dehydratase small subunit